MRHLQLGPMIVGDRPEVVHGDHGAAIGFVRFALVSCPQPNGFLELALLFALCCIAVRARARSAATRERSFLAIKTILLASQTHSDTLRAIATTGNAEFLCFVDQNDHRWTVAIAWLKVDTVNRLNVTAFPHLDVHFGLGPKLL